MGGSAVTAMSGFVKTALGYATLASSPIAHITYPRIVIGVETQRN